MSLIKTYYFLLFCELSIIWIIWVSFDHLLESEKFTFQISSGSRICQNTNLFNSKWDISCLYSTNQSNPGGKLLYLPLQCPLSIFTCYVTNGQQAKEQGYSGSLGGASSGVVGGRHRRLSDWAPARMSWGDSQAQHSTHWQVTWNQRKQGLQRNTMFISYFLH